MPVPNPEELQSRPGSPHRRPATLPGSGADPEVGYGEDLGVPSAGLREDIRVARAYIDALQQAELAGSGLDDDTLNRLRHPRRTPQPITPGERAGLRVFTARGDASEEHYADVREAMLEFHPEDAVPTYEQCQSLMSSTTGITAIRTDMCVNSCVAFTGPFSDRATCPDCGEARYDPLKSKPGRPVARRTFSTFPIGPQIQA
ncbi:hypothetical protein C8Q80DRAFT_1111959, partial [Daedaleopsis nitida]